jgi:hypothetical protein
MEEGTAHTALHGIFHPLIRRMVETVHGALAPFLVVKRKAGLQSEFSKKLDRALQRWVSRFDKVPEEIVNANPGVPVSELAQRTSIIPELQPDAHAVADIAVVLSDLEKTHFPRWFAWLVEDFAGEGLIFYNERTKKVEAMSRGYLNNFGSGR